MYDVNLPSICLEHLRPHAAFQLIRPICANTGYAYPVNGTPRPMSCAILEKNTCGNCSPHPRYQKSSFNSHLFLHLTVPVDMQWPIGVEYLLSCSNI